MQLPPQNNFKIFFLVLTRPHTTIKLEEKLKKSQQKRERKAAGEEKEAKKSRVDRVFVAGRGATVLTETEELDSINYRPKTKQSRWETFDNLIRF